MNGDTKEFSSSQSFEHFCIREREESKEFSDYVVLNSLTREKGDTKEFRRLVLRSFGKGRRETQKEFRRLVLGEFFLAKGEENEKMNSTSFQGFENQKTSESFWYKKEEEVQRDSRLVNDCLNKCSRCLKCKTRPCFYRLFMSGHDNHQKIYDYQKNLIINLKKSKNI